MTGLPPVGVPLVLDDQVLFMDGLQQRRGQRLEVGDGLRCDRQAAALLLQEQLLHCKKNAGKSFNSSTKLVKKENTFKYSVVLGKAVAWKNNASSLRGDTLPKLAAEPTVLRLAAAVSHGSELISSPPAIALQHSQRN